MESNNTGVGKDKIVRPSVACRADRLSYSYEDCYVLL